MTIDTVQGQQPYYQQKWTKLMTLSFASCSAAGGATGANCPGPQCKEALKQCRTCSRSVRQSHSSLAFLRGWFCCIFD